MDLEKRIEWAFRGTSSQAEFLDLSSALEIEGRSGTPLYFLNDGHWTSRGNQVAADNIYRYLWSHSEPTAWPDSVNK